MCVCVVMRDVYIHERKRLFLRIRPWEIEDVHRITRSAAFRKSLRKACFPFRCSTQVFDRIKAYSSSPSREMATEQTEEGRP